MQKLILTTILGIAFTLGFAQSKEELQRQKEKGVQELKDTVASLSVQIAAKIIEKEVNEATHRQLVENLIKDLSKIQKA